MEKAIIIPDVHCRSFYKPVLNITDKLIVFLGDYMDPYPWEDTSDEQGIANLEEIFDFARKNKNVVLLSGNHDEEYIWSRMGFSRTDSRFYNDLHCLYRDNIDLLHPIFQAKDTIFTHAGISRGWINIMHALFKQEGLTFKLTESNIVSYIGNEWLQELQNDKAQNIGFYRFLNSEIFCIGRSRGGDSPYGGPFWSDFYNDYFCPENWSTYQICGHQQGQITGLARTNNGIACLDSRAIFEYDFDTHFVKPSDLNTEKVKSEIPESAWLGVTIKF